MSQDPGTWSVAASAQLGVGSYGGVDERFKRRKRRNQPLGFAPQKPKPKTQKKRHT